MRDEDAWNWWLLPEHLPLETDRQKYNRQQVEALKREHIKQERIFRESMDRLWAKRHPCLGTSLEEDMDGNFVSFLNSIDDWRD